MLTTTYRMNDEINAFPSKRFYNGQLLTDISSAYRRINYTVLPEKNADILDKECPEVFVDLRHCDMTTYCQPEAEIIAELVVESIRCGIDPKDIAIIAPYRAQIHLIKNAIEDLIEDKSVVKGIFIDTVERIQGQERDLVIFSLTTSSLKHAVEKADFFFLPQRLNVALTRAKCKRIIVGSSYLFNSKSNNSEIQKSIDVFTDFYNSTCVIQISVDVTDDLF